MTRPCDSEPVDASVDRPLVGTVEREEDCLVIRLAVYGETRHPVEDVIGLATSLIKSALGDVAPAPPKPVAMPWGSYHSIFERKQ